MSTNTELNSSPEYYLIEKSSNTATKIIPILSASSGNTITGTLTGSNKEETFSSHEYELYATSTDAIKEGQNINFISKTKLHSAILLELEGKTNTLYFKPHDSEELKSVNIKEAIFVESPYLKKLTPRTATNISSPGSRWGVAPGVDPGGVAKVPPTEMIGGRYHHSNCNCVPFCGGMKMERP
ncbi:hypothetical protein [Pseudomonas sp. Irchel 3E19]|uniref:hypothetical protein n=1 Tax=Pseudomonas sp. Irchel 3E19 TaxID=2008981 RepID=UPI00113FEBDD|nr:hypothetical protein [Pseudomonas sp. Irchel 3E19]